VSDIVAADADALAQAAAERIVALSSRPGRIALCLSGGSTPKRLYEVLATPAFRDRMAWDRTHLFWGDERFVPPDDPRSNLAMVRAALLDHVPVPAAQVHPMPTVGLSAEAAAREYEATLRAFKQDGPLFDLVLLGLGTNGHTASLFPGQPTLEERSAWCLPTTPPGEPTRVTLTWPPLEDCREAAFLVAGADKRDVVAAVRHRDPALPASRYAPSGTLQWWLDRAAAGAD
jgi:6-phosphogluconolactonase